MPSRRAFTRAGLGAALICAVPGCSSTGVLGTAELVLESHLERSVTVDIDVENPDGEIYGDRVDLDGAGDDPNVRRFTVREDVISGTEYRVDIETDVGTRAATTHRVDCFRGSEATVDELWVVIDGNDGRITLVDESC